MSLLKACKPAEEKGHETGSSIFQEWEACAVPTAPWAPPPSQTGTSFALLPVGTGSIGLPWLSYLWDEARPVSTTLRSPPLPGKGGGGNPWGPVSFPGAGLLSALL